MDNPYVRLTREFNDGRLRAILASGQAVVLYRLAIMSKDGDWILREEAEALTHVIATLARHGARYRYGAPLDLRWLVHGWSAHLEFQEGGLRLRCDFVTRPPRVSPGSLRALWVAPLPAGGYATPATYEAGDIRTPAIMSTGMSTMENAVRALHSGAIDFVPKPFSADELLAAVQRGIRYARIQSAAPVVTAPGALPALLPYVPCPPKDYRLGYASWVAVEPGGTALVEVSDLFLKTIVGVTAVALAAVDEEVVQGSPCATASSPDGTSHVVLSPVSGRIVEPNEAVAANPSVVERDPYFQGWLYRVLPSDLDYALQHLTSCSSDRVECRSQQRQDNHQMGRSFRQEHLVYNARSHISVWLPGAVSRL